MDAAFVWGDQQQLSFKELVHVLTSTLVLQMLLSNKLFHIYINFSDVAIGALLTQKVNDMDMHVCYYSKLLNETEADWSIYEYELYAIVQALGKWWYYLVNLYTIVYSDH